LPDEFHLLQPRLLGETFCPPDYPADRDLRLSCFVWQEGVNPFIVEPDLGSEQET
jgi:hypothetical protein